VNTAQFYKRRTTLRIATFGITNNTQHNDILHNDTQYNSK